MFLTARLIAILLVTFGFDAQKALENFCDISNKIMNGYSNHTRKERTELLRNMIGDLLMENGFGLDSKLKAPNNRDHGCRLYVFTTTWCYHLC